MKPVLVFRHVPHEHLGSIGAALSRRGVPIQYIDLASSADQPVDLSSSSGLIVMGGPMSANDPDNYISRELYLIGQAIQANLPVLGVCLGSQLIAKAAGARVYRNPVKEIGWYPVSVTPAGSRDPLVHHFAPAAEVFHWHGETFDLPEGAAWLARSEACRHQAFRLGSNVYGFQFHFEVTPEMIAEWCRVDEACGDARECTVTIDAHQNAAQMAAMCDEVVGSWIPLLPG